MTPPLLLFKRCLPHQLIESPNSLSSHPGDGHGQQAQAVGEGSGSSTGGCGSGKYRPPEAGGFRLFTPEEQVAKQQEDVQMAEDMERALAAMMHDKEQQVV
jgi:hypothetical protein